MNFAVYISKVDVGRRALVGRSTGRAPALALSVIMAPKNGSGLMEWAQVGYTDNITSIYVSDDEYVGSAEGLEADIELARRLVTDHRVTADRMLLRAQRLENDRNMMRVDEKFKAHHERINEQVREINKLKGNRRKDRSE